MSFYAFRALFKAPFELVSDSGGRQFLKLCWKLGNKRRKEAGLVKVENHQIKYVDAFSLIWQHYELFFKKSYYFESNNEVPFIIDCGSNVGLSVIYFKRLYPNAEVLAFEADQQIAEVLKENTAHFSNVKIQQAAVWTHDRGVNLVGNSADGAHVSENEGDLVPSYRLKTLLESGREIDLLKIDVEGAEFAILEDCKDHLGKIHRLFVEVHTFGGLDQGIARLLSIIEMAGFRYYIENANVQKRPLAARWKMGETGMDVQLNLYAVRP